MCVLKDMTILEDMTLLHAKFEFVEFVKQLWPHWWNMAD